MAEPRVLVIEDDDATRFLCEALLRKEDYQVVQAADGAAGLKALAGKRFDLILLDLNLPDQDGLELAERIGQMPEDIPIIMMTARDRPEQRMEGFESGAKDYLIKPFHPGELMHRVRNVLAGHQKQKRGAAKALYRLGGWTIDVEARALATGEGGNIDLTRGEFDILAELASRMGRVVDRFELLDIVTRGETEGHPRTVDVLVSRIRKKMEQAPDIPFVIKTVPGIGYQLMMA